MEYIATWLDARAKGTYHRQILLISGERKDVVNKAQQLADAINKMDTAPASLICGDTNLTLATNNRRYSEHLGKEYDYLFYDAFSGFRINAFAALAGTVARNGLLILMTPPLQEWATYPNKTFLNRVSYGFEDQVTSSFFTTSFIHHLKEHPMLLEWQRETIIGQHAAVSDNNITVADGQPTEQQQKVIEQIINVVDGHRKRPLVIRADRGRGKSATLGFAIRQLLTRNKNIAVTAPTIKAVENVFKHSGCQSDTHNVRFVAVDELLRSSLSADLLIVDEAAALPHHLLQQLLLRFNRIVFSSTTYGYEGTGRGFDIRFLPYLKKERPEYKQAQLDEPIRWYKNDALEKFVWEACHLSPMAQTPLDSDNVEHKASKITFREVSKTELAADPVLLNEVFTLLVEAHYQTSPDDLMAMLDAPEQHVFIALVKNAIVGVALANMEGNITQQPLMTDITRCNRRVRGHLLAQQSSIVSATPELLAMRYLRVIRIAVNEKWRRKQIGTLLLQELHGWAKEQNIDILGTSFAVSQDTLRFWLANGYSPMLLGFQKDKSSGEHSVLMLKPVADTNKTCTELSDVAYELFKYHLSGQFKQLSPDIVKPLLNFWGVNQTSETADMQQLTDFALHQRSLEMSLPAISVALQQKDNIAKLNDGEFHLLLRLVLQKWRYSDTAADCKLDGKKAVIKCARESVKKWL